MWLVQRTISTPSTHWAHHALTNADGIGHYKGNFGNMLFVWDMLFGSAHITQKYPAQVGLQDDQLCGRSVGSTKCSTRCCSPSATTRRCVLAGGPSPRRKLPPTPACGLSA